MQSLRVVKHAFIEVIIKEKKQEGEDIWIKCPLTRIYKPIYSRGFFYNKSRHTAIASKTSPKWACFAITVSAPASASALEWPR